MKFRRITPDRNEYHTDNGQYLLQRVYYEGPRGGTRSRWELFEITNGRHVHSGSFKRRKDIRLGAPANGPSHSRLREPPNHYTDVVRPPK
jgi:hypothetical protein